MPVYVTAVMAVSTGVFAADVTPESLSSCKACITVGAPEFRARLVLVLFTNMSPQRWKGLRLSIALLTVIHVWWQPGEVVVVLCCDVSLIRVTPDIKQKTSGHLMEWVYGSTYKQTPPPQSLIPCIVCCVWWSGRCKTCEPPRYKRFGIEADRPDVALHELQPLLSL